MAILSWANWDKMDLFVATITSREKVDVAFSQHTLK